MKLQLPFNLLPSLEGTAIASCFGLKNRPSDNHTMIELSAKETHDLLALLKALEHDHHIRCQKWQRQTARSSVSFSRRAGVEQSRQTVHRAVELIEAFLAASNKTR